MPTKKVKNWPVSLLTGGARTIRRGGNGKKRAAAMGRWATRTAWLDPTVGSSRSRRSEPPPPRFKRSPPLYLAPTPPAPLLITAHRISLLLRSQNPASAAAPAPHPSPGAVSPFPARGGRGTAPLFLAILDRWLPFLCSSLWMDGCRS